jgi:hypothetical protein
MSSRARVIWVGIAVVAVGAAAALYWFQPWRLFTNTTVNETLPSIETTHDSPPSQAQEPVRENVLLASGTIVTHEHESSGAAKLVRLADGRIQLTLENLATSDGPDLHVWLTDQPVIEGNAGWFVFDDGRYVELGPLKGNRGNQVYDVPSGTDLKGLVSVTIWCKRFAVSFGAAALNPQ